MSDRELLALAEEIYDAAAGGTPWQEVCARLGRLIDANSGWLAVADPETGLTDLLYASHFPADEIHAYQTRHRHADLWTVRTAAAVAKAGANGPPRARLSGELVSDAEYLRSEYYAEQGKRLGLRHVVGTVVPLGEAGLLPIGFHRPDGRPPFNAEDARLLNCLLPHIRRAVQLQHRLNPVRSSGPIGVAALDALAIPVVIVKDDLEVVLANAAGEAVLAGRNGLHVVTRKLDPQSTKRVLQAARHADHKGFAQLVRSTALGGSAGGAVRIANGDGVPTTAALVSPLPRRIAENPSAGLARVTKRALIILRDLQASAAPPDAELLRDVFGLTRTEVEISRALFGGATKAAVAAKRGIQESTVKTHVNSILVKTGTSGLRDLERLLASLG